jgi:hypothetical protein
VSIDNNSIDDFFCINEKTNNYLGNSHDKVENHSVDKNGLPEKHMIVDRVGRLGLGPGRVSVHVFWTRRSLPKIKNQL